MIKLHTLILSICLTLLSISSCMSQKESIVTIKTPHGSIEVLLFSETPLHRDNFVNLARTGFYDSTVFHRVIAGFMIQGGDPYTKNPAFPVQSWGTGGPGYQIPAEFNPKFTHIKGAMAAARTGDQVNPKRESSGSQFYIVHGNEGAHFLDGQYTIFGQTIRGLEVIDKIAAQATTYPDRPVQNIPMAMSVSEMSREDITKEYGYIFK
ncbi:MAG: peptidylprolyl isomerase [Cytophagales bacterium]|nr:MAG: peptidylprolyl isomerase [Cytophagales bacterium]TAF61899.1 MAG: peptidylprolyl isomerase [Cytophagales bacterium]